METLSRDMLEWHVESMPFPGNSETGDRGHVNVGNTHAFAFAIDALGHGSEASEVADFAQRQVIDTAMGNRLETIIEISHERLRGTRGAAMCLASVDAGANALTWLSVGNIQGVHIHVDRNGMPQFESLVLRAGVVGDRLPELRASQVQLKPGDMIVLATDGMGYGWYGEFRPGIGPAALARALRERHFSDKDDALVLVLRYQGRDDGATP